MMTSEQIIATTAQYLAEQPDVAAAYIFGSLARRRLRRKSDVDVAVLFASRSTTKLARLDRCFELEAALEELVGRPVQVVDLEASSLLLQHQVRKYGILVAEKDRRRRVRFEVESRRRYFDMQRVYRYRTEAAFKRAGI